MLQLHEIKKEETPLKTTCKPEQDDEARSSDNVRQVLVNFGLNRKKVFTLCKKEEKLHERFKNYILSEPAFSELLEDSYVVFQEFCPRFRTWVDVDVNETQDGAVLNAVFFPSSIERDESNPGSVRGKDVQFVNKKSPNRSCESKKSLIDLAEDKDDVTHTALKSLKHRENVNSSKVKLEEEEKEKSKKIKKLPVKNKIVIKGKKRRKVKKLPTKNKIVTIEGKLEKIKPMSMKNKIVTEESCQKPDNSKLKRKTITKIATEEKNFQILNTKCSMKNNDTVVKGNLQKNVQSKPKKAMISKNNNHLKQEEANRSARNQAVHLSSTSHRFDVLEPPKKRYCSYPENADNSSGFTPQPTRTSLLGSYPGLGDKNVSEINTLSTSKNWPERDSYDTTNSSPIGSFSFELHQDSQFHVTPTKVQPPHFCQGVKLDRFNPDFHLPSNPIGQATGADLPEGAKCDGSASHQMSHQNVMGVRPIHVVREEMPVESNLNQQVPPSIAKPLCVEKQLANNRQDSATVPKVYEKMIFWGRKIPSFLRTKRLNWGQQNIKNNWLETLFSDIAMFSLEENRIKYYEKICFFRTNCIFFWGLRSFDGPNIIASMGLSLSSSTFEEVLKNKVVECVKNHYLSSRVTLQILGVLTTQFQAKKLESLLKENSIYLSKWPGSARNLSPVFHAWRLVAEKVKHIPCSSTEEMISIVSAVWQNDVDVQFMCSKIIKLLPQIILSVVQQGGNNPDFDIKYVVTL